MSIIEKKSVSWDNFKELSHEEIANNPKKNISPILFRGQTDTNYCLETTLERVTRQPSFSANEYYKIIKCAEKKINSCCKHGWHWHLPEPKDIKWDDFFVVNHLEIIEYMAYLRHHGFPSPLLDWTRSPYVAAFFAFHNIDKKNKNPKEASIFIYREYLNSGTYMHNEARIASIGPNIKTSTRHHLQQSEYTYCIKPECEGSTFVNHGLVVKRENTSSTVNTNPKIMTQFTLSYSEQEKILNDLELMNINAYSLFDTVDGFMHSLKIFNFLKYLKE